MSNVPVCLCGSHSLEAVLEGGCSTNTKGPAITRGASKNPVDPSETKRGGSQPSVREEEGSLKIDEGGDSYRAEDRGSAKNKRVFDQNTELTSQ